MRIIEQQSFIQKTKQNKTNIYCQLIDLLQINKFIANKYILFPNNIYFANKYNCIGHKYLDIEYKFLYGKTLLPGTIFQRISCHNRQISKNLRKICTMVL